MKPALPDDEAESQSRPGVPDDDRSHAGGGTGLMISLRPGRPGRAGETGFSLNPPLSAFSFQPVSAAPVNGG
jgi:hypothetical protein